MTLIEILLHYQYMYKTYGKDKAIQWIHSTCDESLWEHIEFSVNEKGNFIDVEGIELESIRINR